MFKVKWIKLFQPIYFEGQLLNNVIRKASDMSLSHEQGITSIKYDNQLNMFIINSKLYIPATNICAFEIEEAECSREIEEIAVTAELKDSSTQKNKLITEKTIRSTRRK